MDRLRFSDEKYKIFLSDQPRKMNNETKEFANINLIYGENGSGKSTLAEYINIIALPDNSSLFNREYIDNNILLEDKKKFKGVKLISGSDNININDKIEQIDKKLTENDNEVIELENVIKRNEKKIKNKCDEIFKEHKGKGKSAIKTFKTYDVAKKFYSGKNYDLSIYDINNLEFYDESDYFDKYPIIPDGEFNNIKEMCMTEYIDTPFSFKDYSWIKKGLSFVEDGKCGFCGSDLSDEKLKEINAYISDTYNLHKSWLTEYIRANNFENIKSPININNKYINNKLIDLSSEITNELVESLKDFINVITLKLSDMRKQIDITDYIESIIYYNELALQYNSEIDKLTTQLIKESEKSNDILKFLIAHEIINDTSIADLKEENEYNEKKISNTLIHNNTLKKEKIELKNELSNYKEFMVFLNIQLDNLDKHFYLELDNEEYILKSKFMNELEYKQLSEGEKFILAYLYFYYENMINFNDNPKTLIFDDPFTSLDSKNQSYIEGSLVDFLKKNKKNINKKDDIQVFILTHHYGFYYDLASSGVKTCIFNLIKKGNESNVVNFKSLVNEYDYLFKSIIDFCDSPDDSQGVHIANAIRRCIETYCRFNFKIQGVSDTEAYKVVLYGDDDKIGIKSAGFLKFLNNGSHSIHNDFNIVEIEKYANEFKNIFSEKYTEHYNAIMNA